MLSIDSKNKGNNGEAITPLVSSPNQQKIQMAAPTCSNGIAKSLDPKIALGKEAAISFKWTLLTTTLSGTTILTKTS